MSERVNRGATLSVHESEHRGHLVIARGEFAERQHRGLAVLIALSAAQLLDPDRADTEILNVLWAA